MESSTKRQAETAHLERCSAPIDFAKAFKGELRMAADYTPRQGQYLAFIYHYTKVNGRPPAEADLQRYFRTSPPSVHQMILTLERRGLLARVPGQPRSIHVLLPHERLPPLGSSPGVQEIPHAPAEDAMMRRKGKGTSSPAAKQARTVPALDRLKGDEATRLLHALLGRHPELADELQELASSELGDVSIEEVADEVEAAVDGLDLDDLNSRAGRHRHGYVEPSQAAWDLVEEAVMPFIEDMKRRTEAGQDEAALATCVGIVLGLYRLRDKDNDEFLGWAVDSPDEMAGEAVVTLRKALRAAKRRRGSRESSVPLPAILRDTAPEWAEMLDRCWHRPG
jgi:hypothetical protein